MERFNKYKNEFKSKYEEVKKDLKSKIDEKQE